MKAPTDKEMLDWIERERAEIRVGSDLMVEPWTVAWGGEPGDERVWVADGVTPRQAIAKAMKEDA